jgi:hypothetical protein
MIHGNTVPSVQNRNNRVQDKLAIMVPAAGLLATQVSAGEQQVLKTEQDRVNYGIGVRRAGGRSRN